MSDIQTIIKEEARRLFINEKFKKGSKMTKDELNTAAKLASKETSDIARELVNNDFINLSAVAQEVDPDASSKQSAQSSVRKEVLGLGSDGKPDGKPMRADYAQRIIKIAKNLQ